MMDQLMKSYMAIMAEKEAAIRERNMAIVEKKKALADRDIAMLERDTAMSERDSVMMQRNDVIAQLQYHSSTLSGNNLSHGMSVNGIFRGGREKPTHQHHQHQHINLTSQLAEAAYNPREVPFSDTFPDSELAFESTKSKKVKKTKQPKTVPSKKSPKVSKRGKRVSKVSSRQPKNDGSNVIWNNELDEEWKNNLELSLVKFDDGTVPVPVCSCTGNLQSCYKWGHGGWQSACCTTTISMFPLPQTGNKRNSRIGGRKMSGSVYNKLLTRLAAEGYDFSNPVDLKEHWAKHGTNRYITIK